MQNDTNSSISMWPRPVRYAYFLASNLRFMNYHDWCQSGEPNPFARRLRRRRQQTTEQEIADIFDMTSQELSAFGAAQSGQVPARSRRQAVNR